MTHMDTAKWYDKQCLAGASGGVCKRMFKVKQ